MSPELSSKERLERDCREFIAAAIDPSVEDAMVGRLLSHLVPDIIEWVKREILYCRQGMPQRLEPALEVQDIIQEVLIRMAKRPAFHGVGNSATCVLRAWVKQVAGNLWNDILRRRRKMVAGQGLHPAPDLGRQVAVEPAWGRSESLERVVVDPDSPENIVEELDWQGVASLLIDRISDALKDKPQFHLLFVLEVEAARGELKPASCVYAQKLGVKVGNLYKIRQRMYETILTFDWFIEYMRLWGVRTRP